MSIQSVIVGTVVRFYTSKPFSNADGTPVDPTTVAFAYQVGTGPVRQVTYGTSQPWGAITKDGTGLYHVDIDTSGQAGIWSWAWGCSGGIQTRTEGQLQVNPATVPITA